jgi:hypothetical protein
LTQADGIWWHSEYCPAGCDKLGYRSGVYEGTQPVAFFTIHKFCTNPLLHARTRGHVRTTCASYLNSAKFVHPDIVMYNTLERTASKSSSGEHIYWSSAATAYSTMIASFESPKRDVPFVIALTSPTSSISRSVKSSRYDSSTSSSTLL